MERNSLGQEIEVPTLFIPTIHQIWFQMPLDDSQTSNRPPGERLVTTTDLLKKPVCAEGSPQMAPLNLSLKLTFLSPKAAILRRNTLIWIFKF